MIKSLITSPIIDSGVYPTFYLMSTERVVFSIGRQTEREADQSPPFSNNRSYKAAPLPVFKAHTGTALFED